MKARPAFPNPQERVFDAIDRARVARGVVAPLSPSARAVTSKLLGLLGIPHRPESGAAPDSDSS